MALTGLAKKRYQRRYMRQRRAGLTERACRSNKNLDKTAKTAKTLTPESRSPRSVAQLVEQWSPNALADARATLKTKPSRSNKKRRMLDLFLKSKQAQNISPTTMRFYRIRLEHAAYCLDDADAFDIEEFLDQYENPYYRHHHYQVLKTFYKWRKHRFGFEDPMEGMPGPKVPKLIYPSLTRKQVMALLAGLSARDRAIIALFTESGLRLSELANIHLGDIDWAGHCIRTLGKGGKEAYAPFGELSAGYLAEWLAEFQPGGGNIWGINKHGVVSMLRRLEKNTGIKCNAHVFRRTFACLLRQAGVDYLQIQRLGRWESVEMVQRYTRGFTFQDAMQQYRAPLGEAK